jgi:tetratricopeptide (TPR) repeat protein
MNLRKASIEDLLDYQQELHLARDEEREGSLRILVELYDELYKRISRDRDSEYAPSLDGIKKRLVSYLVRYGTYLKVEDKKDDYAAESALKKAIGIQRQLPIAYYRLGFLNFKKRSYSMALLHLENALGINERIESEEYVLNDQQRYNARLYMINSALYIAEKAQKELDQETDIVQGGPLPNLELSPMYEMIRNNEHYLQTNAFTMMTKDSRKHMSREDCDRFVEQPQAAIILYFSDQQNLIIFLGEEKVLTSNQAEMLRYFLLYSNEQEPVLKNSFFDLFIGGDANGEIPNNTYTQNVARLRTKLINAGISDSVIESKSTPAGPGYYFNENLPYFIIHRSDASFILN